MSVVPIYAIADLHLSHDGSKPMDHFHPIWRNHEQVLFQRWNDTVPQDAVVLMPGDHSWASRPDDIAVDFRRIDQLTGSTKLLGPGNHDFGVWANASRARRSTEPFPTMHAIKDTILRVQRPGVVDMLVVAIRGVDHVDDLQSPATTRALRRLTALLSSANQQRTDREVMVVMIHHPPFSQLSAPSPFTDAIEDANVDLCVYGHLHDADVAANAFEGRRHNTVYRLVSAPVLRMNPTRIGTITADGLLLASR